jgi:hypothetical protein
VRHRTPIGLPKPEAVLNALSRRRAVQEQSAVNRLTVGQSGDETGPPPRAADDEGPSSTFLQELAPTSYEERDALLLSLGYGSYREYLQSYLWLEVRARAWMTHGKECRICKRRRATVLHHLTYDVEVLMGYDLDKLVPLCYHCHEEVEVDEMGEKRSLPEAQVKYHELLASPPSRRVLRDDLFG